MPYQKIWGWIQSKLGGKMSGKMGGESTETKNIPIHISRAYLDMARCIFKSNLRWRKEEGNSEAASKGLPENQSEGLFSTTNFAFGSLAAIYSYLAVEAFINYQLYEIWRESREIQRIFKLQADTGHPLNAKAYYAEFYKQYGHINDFEEMVRVKLSDLKDRINVVCEAEGIEKISKSNKPLWDQFLDLVEATRHKLVHPNPKELFLENTHNRIFSPDYFEKYPVLAGNIIGHFYKARNMPLPDYLSKNTLFEIPVIELLFDPQIETE